MVKQLPDQRQRSRSAAALSGGASAHDTALDTVGWGSASALAGAAARAAGARGAVVARFSEVDDQLELVAAAGIEDEAINRGRRQSLDADSLLAEAGRTRQTVEARGGILSGELATGRAVAFPLVSGARLLGVLGFEFSTTVATPREPACLQAAVAATEEALARIESAEAHDRAERLQKLTAILAAVQPRVQIADAIVAEAIEATGAVAGSVTLLDERRHELRIVSYRGYPRELVDAFNPMPADLRTPFSDAALRGELVVLETTQEYDDRYPEVEARRGRSAEHAIVALPLAAGGAPFGSIGLSFPAPRVFDDEERAFLLALARLCAQAVDRSERARLYEWMMRLQAVTAELSRAVTQEDVGRVVVDQALAALGAAAGRVARIDPRTRALVTIAASDDYVEVEQRLRELGEDDAMPLAASARRNVPILIGSLETDGGEWPLASQEFRRLGHNALSAFPLRSGGRVVGAIAFTWREEQRFLDDHAPFLNALAAVCGQALERTRFYEETERSRTRLRHLLDRLDEAVLVVDELLRVTYANSGAPELFGRRKLVGRLLPDRWPELRLRELARLMFEPDAQPLDEFVTLADGRTLELVALPDPERPMLVLRDVSRRERQEQSEREFVANAAHELRSPLAGIATAVDALQLGAKEIPGERDYYISGIESEVGRLVRLSDALLLLARAQADPGLFTAEPVAMEPLLTEIASRLQVRPGVRVVANSSDCVVSGDQVLLEAAISNLAQNASRHTTSGTIELSCTCDGERSVISVADTGDGMSPDVRARATERFFRGGNRTREGFGLGLALATQMVAALGGELQISAGRRSGTTVTITLPNVCAAGS